jgi:DNA mismatch endonuclease (patch repair protein)
MDVFSKAKRSQVMSRIRDRGNRSTEGTFAALLRRSRISGWKLQCSAVAGKPDFYFKKRKLAVFVDGCFWHGCPRCFRAPRQNALFWAKKIAGNRNRDRKVTCALRHEGIKVIRLWEHDLEKRTRKVVSVLEQLGRGQDFEVGFAASSDTVK